MASARYAPLVDEKHDGQFSARPPPPWRSRVISRLVSAILLTSAALLLVRTAFVCPKGYDPREGLEAGRSLQDVMGMEKVPLEAHIMSKCPDARDCLQQLVVPTMEQVSEKVNFTLSYIGSFDDKSDAVACKHGPAECLGNMIELCAARIYPDPKIYLGFTNCMTANYSQIPDRNLVENCALEHGIDFNRVNKCISDQGHGSELLRDSFLRSQENNVTKSCTVRLAGKIRCIRDGGEWYDCPGGSTVADLVRDIDKLYNGGSLQLG